MGYTYNRRSATRNPDLEYYRLDGLLRGEPVTLYHGTTRMFRSFDVTKSRTDLVNKFYGAGIFLTPSKRVAGKYADANRNIGFDPEIIEDLKRRNPAAGKFMHDLYSRGDDAWEDFTPERFKVAPEDFTAAVERHLNGLDPNTIADVCRFILGSKLRSSIDDLSSGTLNIFHQSTGLPDWAYKNLDELGLDSDVYRPKIYTVDVRVSKTLVTASKSAARSARSKGYDCVVYHGSDLVDDVPEVAVFDPRNARIRGFYVI